MRGRGAARNEGRDAARRNAPVGGAVDRRNHPDEHDAAAAARRQTPSDLIIVRLEPVPRAKRSRARACAGARPTGRRRARCALAPATARASAVGCALRAHPWSARGRDVRSRAASACWNSTSLLSKPRAMGNDYSILQTMPIAHDAVAARRARLQDSLSLSPGPLEQAIRTYRAIASRACRRTVRAAMRRSGAATPPSRRKSPTGSAGSPHPRAWRMQSASSGTLPAAFIVARSTMWSCSAWADRVSRPKF